MRKMGLAYALGVLACVGTADGARAQPGAPPGHPGVMNASGYANGQELGMEPDASIRDRQFKAEMGNGAMQAVAVPVMPDAAVPQPQARVQTTDDLLRVLIQHVDAAAAEQHAASMDRRVETAEAQQWSRVVNNRTQALLTQDPSVLSELVHLLSPVFFLLCGLVFMGWLLPLSIVLWRHAAPALPRARSPLSKRRVGSEPSVVP